MAAHVLFTLAFSAVVAPGASLEGPFFNETGRRGLEYARSAEDLAALQLAPRLLAASAEGVSNAPMISGHQWRYKYNFVVEVWTALSTNMSARVFRMQPGSLPWQLVVCILRLTASGLFLGLGCAGMYGGPRHIRSGMLRRASSISGS